MVGHWISQSIYVAAKLGVADHLASGPQSIEDLARAVDAHAPSLHRLLRALASVGLFTEVAPQQYALTPVGYFLRTGVPGSLRALAFIATEFDWQPWGQMLLPSDRRDSVPAGLESVPSTTSQSIGRWPDVGNDDRLVAQNIRAVVAA
jgi:hypothetical protein